MSFLFLKPKLGFFYKLVFVFFFSSFFAISKSQNFQFRTYSFDNGLSSYNAGKIVQDKFGFIWIATQEGINRFDGKDFIAIKKDPLQNKGLNENYVTDAVIDQEGKLWISSALGGIDVLNPENFKIEKKLTADSVSNNSLITNWVRCLAWSERQDLWIGTYYGFNVYNKKNNTFTSFTENPFNKKHDLNICFVGIDSLHNMWLVAENDGLIIFNPDTKKIITKMSKEDLGIKPDETFTVKTLFIDTLNSIYLCSNRGLKHIIFDNQKYLHSSIETISLSKLNSYDIRGIVKDDNGQIWIGTENGIQVVDKTNNSQLVKHSNFFYNTILDDNINYLFKDAFGNIWATTTKGLNLLINDKFRFQAFNTKSGMLNEMRNVNTLYPDNDSVIYSCAATGLFKINIKNFSTNKILQSDQYGEIESLIRINQNGFLVSSIQKLIYLQDVDSHFRSFEASSVFNELTPIQFNYFSSCLRYNDSIILLGSMEDEGLFKWDIKNHVLKQFKRMPDINSLYENNIHNIKKDKLGNVWILGNSSIAKYNPINDMFKNYFPEIENNEKSLPHFFFDLYDDGKHLWITSYGYGLIRFDISQNTYTSYTEKNGLSSNATYNIINENDSIIWVSSNKGLTRFNTSSGKTSTYYRNDGLQSDAFDERSACKVGSSIFFGGIDGFSEISENILFNSISKIPVYIGKIIYTNEAGELVEINSLNEIVTDLKFKASPVTFHIISPDYNNNNRISYAYKIQEINSNWIQMGQNNQITLAGLSPGLYHFQGRIYNSDGNANESKNIEFIILPQWYQTIFFKTTVLLLAIGLFYSFYRYRIAQIKLQQTKLRQVREEIAGDLHDDIGSTLNTIKIFTHLAEQSADKKKYFGQIKESLKQASEGLRDMLWVLDDNNDTADELIKRLQWFTQPVAEASGINIEFSMDGMAGTILNKTEKRNLLMITKEAVNNSIKYAGCNNIKVFFTKTADGKILVIQDDGKGFAEDAITLGNGLKNMRARAKQIKYNIQLRAPSNEGTIITLTSKV